MQKFKIIHQNAQYLRSKTEIFTVFLQSTSPDILTFSEHGHKEDEITQCLIEGYTLTSNFCRKEHKGGGIAIYNSKPSARGYNWATLFLGDINTGTWSSRLGESQMRQ
jgi:exonuclease III